MWEPILHGPLAVRATNALRRIAIDLARADGPATELLVFWQYVTALFDDLEEHHDAAVVRLGRAIEGGATTPALYGGLSGIGWTVAHCLDNEELLEVIDARLVE